MLKPAYQGTGKYIFISYAHKDIQLVTPFLEALQERFNVWYDEGIQFGKEWDEEIIEHISNCSLFIFLITENSLASENCMDEITFAKNNSIPFINVYVEDVKNVPEKFNFRFSRFQNCTLYRYQDVRNAINDLVKKGHEFFEPVKIEGGQEREEVIYHATDDNKDKFIIKGKTLVKYNGHDDVVNIPTNISVIGKNAFRYASMRKAVMRNNVIKIMDGAFADCEKLQSIEFTENMKFLGQEAFARCSSLSSVTFHKESFLEISAKAFIKCTSLKELVFADHIRKIGDSAFEECTSLKSVTFVKYNFASLGNSVFSKCSSLEEVIIPDCGVKTMGKYAFFQCTSLKKIDLSRLASFIKQKVNEGAFWSCTSLKEVILRDNFVEIGIYAFCDCKSLANIKLPYGIKSIKEAAFDACESLEFIYVPSSVKLIGKRAFWGCTSLEAINLPESLKVIKEDVFYKCEKLQKIMYHGDMKKWLKINKGDIPDVEMVYL